jgi:exodeoxyribonuclease VII large subunit
MDVKLKTEKIYSILELNNAVRGVLNREFPNLIWVYGEIQDYNKNKHKRHIFFKLCEKHPEIDQIIAQVSVVIFERTKERLTQILKQTENSFELQDDIEVKFLCRVDLYPKSGGFMLIVENIDPVYTLGKLAQSRQKIIADLKARGLLNKNKQLPLASVPLNIGLITAFDSAAYHDFLDELKKSGFGFKVYHFNSYMQGKNVESDICNALGIFSSYKDIDTIVIARGGGSTADLSWFDNKKIAEKIASSKIPVLSGIGHEINITVTDLVAHTYLKTPTAIAQYLIKRIEYFLESATKKVQDITIFSNKLIQDSRERLSRIVSATRLTTLSFISNSQTELRSKTRELSIQTNYYLRDVKKDMIRTSKGFALANFKKIFEFHKKDLIEKTKSLKKFSFDVIEDALMHIKHCEQSASMLDPMNIVKRGFSITKNIKGETVKNIEDVKKKDRLITIISNGKIESRVESKKKE